ncbi:MAG: class II aldolase/adducin family protein [Pseudomonadota bacterium]
MRRFEHLNKEIMQHIVPNPGKRRLLPELSAKAQVALMCRMCFREGWNDHIAGHITLRLENGNILSNPWELAWDEITAGDVVTLDADGNNLDSDWNITPAIGLHLQLHRMRDDAHVVMHNHPEWSGRWACLQRVPPIYDQSGAYVEGDLPLFDEYQGTFDSDDKTLAAATALGDAKWALLANHGALVVGKNLRQAHLRIITLEWRCRRAYEIELAGGAEPLPAALIPETARADDNGFPFLWEAMARREIRKDPAVLQE